MRIHLPKDLRSIGPRETVWKSILEVQRRTPDGIPLLDPIENMGIKDEKFKVLVKVSSRLIDFPIDITSVQLENPNYGA